MEQRNISLTLYEQKLLEVLRFFERLDKNSQDRLRSEINATRKTSPAFQAAFYSAFAGAQPERREDGGILRTMQEVVTHPIREAKGMVGAALIKRRNKASELLRHPHPILSAVAERWNFRTEKKEDLMEIIRKLGATLREVTHGDRLGMAAPQIGISKRVFVCRGVVCVNPTWRTTSVPQKIEVREGCYSIPEGEIWKVQRDKYGWATFFSVDGEVRQFKLTGLDAIVYQHELDHLDGKCCCDIGVRE